MEVPRYSRPILGRLRYVLSPMALIDLLAVVPFYLSRFRVDMVALRTVRFFRLFRIAKLGRYSTAFRILGGVFAAKRGELIIALFIILMLAVLSAIGIYHAENEAQPTVFSDIPTAMFWSVQALTNVGHVDPVTPAGKILASVISILGLAMFALPTGILGAGFVEEFQKRSGASRHCPHCGKEIDPKG